MSMYEGVRTVRINAVNLELCFYLRQTQQKANS